MVVSRTERQKECIKKWIEANGRASLELATGFGKTRVAGMIIQRYLRQNPNAKILVSVPTEVLKTQWIENLIKWQLFDHCKVEIVNTVVKQNWDVELLIIDEAHRHAAEQFAQIFKRVNYNHILSLTGTMERLDGREKYVLKYCPIVDTITVEEAVQNGWLSEYKDYKVLIDVDLTEYRELDRKFNLYFAYFNYDYPLAMELVKNQNGFRFKYAKKMGLDPKELTTMCFDWMRMMRERKKFVYSHPKKIEIAHKILEARQDKKCITFSATIEDAKKIKYGKVLSSKETKAKNRVTMEEFKKASVGVLNTSKKVDEGGDIPGLSVGVVLAGDSSKSRKRQRTGRVIRKEGDKVSEMFAIIIRGTVDEIWFNNSTQSSYITINEEQLEQVLRGEEITTRQRNNIQNLEFRF